MVSRKNGIWAESIGCKVNSSGPKIRYNAKKFKTIIANSHASKLILNKRFGIDKRKIKVIHNGHISKKFVIHDKGRFSKNFSIGFIGRLDSPKGIHILIQAAKENKNATIVLNSNVEKSEAYQLIGYLPGKHYGTEKDEQIILTNHTDGPSITQDNGALGILGIIKYFSNIPQDQRDRTLLS